MKIIKIILVKRKMIVVINRNEYMVIHDIFRYAYNITHITLSFVLFQAFLSMSQEINK
jgi:hypothetical protein